MFFLIISFIHFEKKKITELCSVRVTFLISIRRLPEHVMKSMIISWNIKEKEAGFQQIHGKIRNKIENLESKNRNKKKSTRRISKWMWHTEPWWLGATFTFQVINEMSKAFRRENELQNIMDEMKDCFVADAVYPNQITGYHRHLFPHLMQRVATNSTK